MNDPRDPNAQTRYTYNANNQVLETTLPATNRGELKLVNTYDGVGRLLTTSKRTGDGAIDATTSYTYDDKGALVRENHADGGYLLYTTDTFGQRITSSQYLSASQAVTYSYTYDLLGNLATRTSGQVTVYDWNVANNAAVAQGTRRIVDAYSYDELGRRIGASNYHIDASGAVKYDKIDVSALRYDVAGNIISATDANGFTTLRAYDALGNKTGSVKRAGMHRAAAAR